LARAFPPDLPLLARAGDFDGLSSISPVAIRMTWTALPITSAERLAPVGVLGTERLLFHGPAVGVFDPDVLESLDAKLMDDV
jgi:hypothetical protein